MREAPPTAYSSHSLKTHDTKKICPDSSANWTRGPCVASHRPVLAELHYNERYKAAARSSCSEHACVIAVHPARPRRLFLLQT